MLAMQLSRLLRMVGTLLGSVMVQAASDGEVRQVSSREQTPASHFPDNINITTFSSLLLSPDSTPGRLVEEPYVSVQSVEAGSDMQDCIGARSEVRLLQVEAEHLAGTLDQRLCSRETLTYL